MAGSYFAGPSWVVSYVIAVTEAYIGCREVLAYVLVGISSSGRTSQALDLGKLV